MNKKAKKFLPVLLAIIVVIMVPLFNQEPLTAEEEQARADSAYVHDHYFKQEFRIPMRDGKELFTAVYTPKDTTTSYPILFKRTPYSCQPYGERMKYPLGPSRELMEDKYIFVYQDVRGKFMSDGKYENMRPMRHRSDPQATDESTDTYDAIDWLVANLKHHNGKVGMWGVSYPGFYAAAATVDAHPALVAVSPQAPIGDWWYDDFHHHGAFFMVHGYWFLYKFGVPRPTLTKEWAPAFKFPTEDGYQFFQDSIKTAAGINHYYKNQVEFWNQMVEHPNYDEFWQERSLIPHLGESGPATLVVGGWFDAEDLYGPLSVYAALEEHDSTNTRNTLVMGPWVHGGWARSDGTELGDVWFGNDPAPSDHYRKEVELPWFQHHLKGAPDPQLPPVLAFNTGANTFREYQQWPPTNTVKDSFAISGFGMIIDDSDMVDTVAPSLSLAFISDPFDPVPYTQTQGTSIVKTYMTEDQRFATERDDVLTFSFPVEEELTLAGDFLAHLKVSTGQTDADWIVKIIDRYPEDHPGFPNTPDSVNLGGYEQMVRSEVIRGRFRNDPSQPEPFSPSVVTAVDLPLQDCHHTFLPGHELVIQIQSTWFPLVDVNPQQYVPNIYQATTEDFKKAEHQVWVEEGGTWFEFDRLPK